VTRRPLKVGIGHPLDLEAAFLDLFRKRSCEDEGDQGHEEEGLK
jgi:hypothetical protein